MWHDLHRLVVELLCNRLGQYLTHQTMLRQASWSQVVAATPDRPNCINVSFLTTWLIRQERIRMAVESLASFRDLR